MSGVCPAPLDLGDKLARTCGRVVAGELAPGVGRCAVHLTVDGRVAELEARAVMRELAVRLLRRHVDEHEPRRETDRDGTEWTWEDEA